jgi:hypothetical protein
MVKICVETQFFDHVSIYSFLAGVFTQQVQTLPPAADAHHKKEKTDTRRRSHKLSQSLDAAWWRCVALTRLPLAGWLRIASVGGRLLLLCSNALSGLKSS